MYRQKNYPDLSDLITGIIFTGQNNHSNYFMQKRNPNEDQKTQSKPAETTQLNSSPDEKVTEALEQAEADMEQDTDLNTEPDPAADLDEGELARLEGEK